MEMDKVIKILDISQLFSSSKYEIPIYQRNYSWGATEIEQLIEDIQDSDIDYYLGNLIVNQKDRNIFEVIDGQQRLTTLYLLVKYLGDGIPEGALYFEAREKSNRTLESIGIDDKSYIREELQSKEIMQGYDIIEKYFQGDEISKEKVRKRLNNVKLIRIQVPKNIDLNHYFEIMNTRGEQLEYHEIAKAKILSKLSTDDKKAGSMIWESCSDMSSYIQMNFKKKVRDELFTKDWDIISSDIKSFGDIKQVISSEDSKDKSNLEYTKNKSDLEQRTLINIIENSKPDNYKMTDEESEDNNRFGSIISFPNFLLQVNKVLSDTDEDESSLDDKQFLKRMEHNWESKEKAEEFLYILFKCRYLFDKFIIKREYVGNYKEDGRWSLQKLESYEDKSKMDLKPKYVGTFDIEENRLIRSLESCLRITYTSPKTMHWISLVLKELSKSEDVDLKVILEKYAKGKIRTSNYKKASGFEFERIVFTYLDYVLYRDGYSYKGNNIIKKTRENWEFQFRNSIEHFYPQNPTEVEDYKQTDPKLLNCFGNLALITISGNSRFSNLPPKGKIESYPKIFEQSLKLQIMKSMIENGSNDLTKDEIEKHEKEMFNLLDKEINH